MKLKSKMQDTAKMSAAPTKSLPPGMTVGKPKAMAAAMTPMSKSKSKTIKPKMK